MSADTLRPFFTVFIHLLGLSSISYPLCRHPARRVTQSKTLQVVQARGGENQGRRQALQRRLGLTGLKSEGEMLGGSCRARWAHLSRVQMLTGAAPAPGRLSPFVPPSPLIGALLSLPPAPPLTGYLTSSGPSSWLCRGSHKPVALPLSLGPPGRSPGHRPVLPSWGCGSVTHELLQLVFPGLSQRHPWTPRSQGDLN